MEEILTDSAPKKTPKPRKPRTPKEPKEKKPKVKLPPKHFRDMLADPLGITPHPASPVCAKCKILGCGAKNPFIGATGADQPKILVVMESVSRGEDKAGAVTTGEGYNQMVRRNIVALLPEGIKEEEIRWITVTQCAPLDGSLPNFKTAANWCRTFVVQDIIEHRPQLIIPVGTVALGALSHKSNAQEWQGKVLTYRGWPDDWVAKWHMGHPVFGPLPEWRIPMIPIQHPRIVMAMRNKEELKQWRRTIRGALTTFVKGIVAPSYDREWYRTTTDPEEVKQAMQWLIDHPKTRVTLDSETTGLKPFFKKHSAVYLMFRWEDEEGNPKSIGFPWVYPESPMLPFVEELTPIILEALYGSLLEGHNLVFDIMFICGTFRGADLNKLCAALHRDSMHLIYTLRQQPGSLGLELQTYKWAKELAGYEEGLTMMIETHPELLDPSHDSKPGERMPHYANALHDPLGSEFHQREFQRYVMGDVESCRIITDNVLAELETTQPFLIPVSHATRRGAYRRWKTPTRQWVADNIMHLGNRVISKIMARGMQIDPAELEAQEDSFPKLIKESREKLRHSSEQIISWCEQQESLEPGWEFDLENKKILKTTLYRVLNLPITRLTKGGQKKYPDIKKCPPDELFEYASTDKYVMNELAVKHPEIRPLQDYRKLYRQYTGFVRPLRNVMNEGIDKKARAKDQHLMDDGRVHAQFKLAGTRSGRLSSAEPNLQNLPKEGVMKRVFVSRYGDAGCIYGADLSQIELRIIASACGDPNMVKAYVDDIDLHSLTHSMVFDRKFDHCTKDHMAWLESKGREDEAKKIDIERRIAKIVNFLTGYGGGAFGLMTALAAGAVYLTEDRCQQIISRFMESYPNLKKHIGYYKHFIEDNGCAVSFFGRVRWFDEVYGDDEKTKSKALRAGYNHLIQSTASDMMLVCLDTIDGLLVDAGLESCLVSTVHDSLVIDARRDELPRVHEIVDGVINNIPEVLETLFPEYDTSWMIVPFAGDCEVGLNYADGRKIPKNPDWDLLLHSKH